MKPHFENLTIVKLNCALLNSSVKVLTSLLLQNVTLFEDTVFKEIIKLKEAFRVKPNPICIYVWMFACAQSSVLSDSLRPHRL